MSQQKGAPMKSPVGWALLGLVIERPSYAYKLAQRFERTYRDALSLSSASHVYTALDALESRAPTEEVPGTREGRQPRPRYRATDAGLDSYGERLVGLVREDRQRQRLIVLQFLALSRHPDVALKILGRYEQAWLDEALQAPTQGPDDAADERDPERILRLLGEENRLAVEASSRGWDVRRGSSMTALRPRGEVDTRAVGSFGRPPAGPECVSAQST
jgi:DNA-binding PadR family transcriptional regulator